MHFCKQFIWALFHTSLNKSGIPTGKCWFRVCLYQLTAYCNFLSTCLQDCGEFKIDTYTQISCAGCLCSAASWHLEIWVQSSFSLWRNAGREFCMTGQRAVTTLTYVRVAGIFVGDIAVAILVILTIRHPRIQDCSFDKTVWLTDSIPLIEMSFLWQKINTFKMQKEPGTVITVILRCKISDWTQLKHEKKTFPHPIALPLLTKGCDLALLCFTNTNIKSLLNYFFLFFFFFQFLQERIANQEKLITKTIICQMQVLIEKVFLAALKMEETEENKIDGAKCCLLDWLFWCESVSLFSLLFLSDLKSTVFMPASPSLPCQRILTLNPSNNEAWPTGTL